MVTDEITVFLMLEERRHRHSARLLAFLSRTERFFFVATHNMNVQLLIFEERKHSQSFIKYDIDGKEENKTYFSFLGIFDRFMDEKRHISRDCLVLKARTHNRHLNLAQIS